MDKREPGLVFQSATNTTQLNAFLHYANAATDSTQQTFYSKSLTLKDLNGTPAKNFVNYCFNAGLIDRRSWWFQLDLHGGINSAVTNGDFSSSSYGHRDKLYLIQFYDEVFSGAYPSNGFSFLDNFVANVTAPLPPLNWRMYINYADPRLSRMAAVQAYYGKNLARLQGLKAFYDPNELFHSPLSISPVVA